MAESFKNQVDALTGFASTEDNALSDWLTYGARLVLNAMPIHKLQRTTEEASFANTTTSEDKRIVEVLRKDATNGNKLMVCRKLTTKSLGRVEDANYMEYATVTDPAYILHDNQIQTFPGGAGGNDSLVLFIDSDITVAHGDTSISNLPDEAEYAVVLYAARQALARKVSDANADEDMELAASYSNQYALVDAQYKEALQILGIEEIEERKLQKDAR